MPRPTIVTKTLGLHELLFLSFLAFVKSEKKNDQRKNSTLKHAAHATKVLGLVIQITPRKALNINYYHTLKIKSNIPCPTFQLKSRQTSISYTLNSYGVSK